MDPTPQQGNPDQQQQKNKKSTETKPGSKAPPRPQ